MSIFSSYKQQAIRAERATLRGIPIKWCKTSAQDVQAVNAGLNVKQGINKTTKMRKAQARAMERVSLYYLKAKVRFFQAKNNLLACEKVEATCKWVQELKATRNAMRDIQQRASNLATYNIEELAERFKEAEAKI